MKDWYFFVREASAGNRRAARSVATRLGSRGVGSKLRQGCANSHPRLMHASLDPLESTSQTASWSV